jgi:hypothetical protein
LTEGERSVAARKIDSAVQETGSAVQCSAGDRQCSAGDRQCSARDRQCSAVQETDSAVQETDSAVQCSAVQCRRQCSAGDSSRMKMKASKVETGAWGNFRYLHQLFP